ncbi:SecY-interacting protein [Nitrincola sp. A-D6]|uniref:SecY-interacting protein n=1 Tax=Nitrincola sp. A-D6 TaxID=1545442 RepID=UPI0006919668|nr:SecY-interacting protein [Nitrincola sp. A-D6]
MRSASTPVMNALDQFIEKLHQNCQIHGWPQQAYDPEWPSDCWQNEAQEGVLTLWKPVLQRQTTDMFQRLGEALDTELHPDIADFYSRYWSDPLPAQAEQGELSLLQVWNNDDLERLRANLIGHALEKQRRKLPLTLFFAVTLPDANLMLSVNNADGSIWLEAPGKPPHQRLADSLADFLTTLEPLPFD